MAQTHTPFPSNFFIILTLFSLSIPASFAYSRSLLQQKQQFQLFDVAASLQKTTQVFSEDRAQPTTTPATTSSGLSLSLHPRYSITKPKTQNYSDLVLARIAADSARINYINSKLQLSLSNFNPSNLQNEVQQEDLETPVTASGGGYVVRLGVGQPVKEFYFLADTGSDVNWLQCLPCNECFRQADPVFNPSESSSYRLLSCASQQCTSLHKGSCDGDTCMYDVSYGDQSFSNGEFATETLSFGNSGSVDNVAIGCGNDNKAANGDLNGAAGIIGLGSSVIALPSQVKATSFSYCLVDFDSKSFSTLEFNSAPPDDSLLVPMVINPSKNIFYFVELTGIIVGRDLISIPPSNDQNGQGGTIVDSGTTLTYLPSEVYNAIRDTFVKYTVNLTPTIGVRPFETCYDMSTMSNVTVPKMSFQFSGDKTLLLRPENYLRPVNSNGIICLAFARRFSPFSIIGNIQQQGMRVTYDLDKKLIGFSPNKC